MNYWVLAKKYYRIMQKDWAYASNKPVELRNLKAILNLISEEKLEEICKYVYKHQPFEMRKFGKIRKNLDELVELSVNYDAEFEMTEGFRYVDRVAKRQAYEEWKRLRRRYEWKGNERIEGSALQH